MASIVIAVRRTRSAVHDTFGRLLPFVTLDAVITDAEAGVVYGAYRVPEWLDRNLTRKDRVTMCKTARGAVAMAAGVPKRHVSVSWTYRE